MENKTQVEQSIEQLPASPMADMEGTREILTQLERIINAEAHLSSEAKQKALQQIKILAEAGTSPQASNHSSQAQVALQSLREIATDSSSAQELRETGKRLLPQLASIFGLPE